MNGKLTEAVVGAGGGVTVASAWADLLVSAWAVAVIVAVTVEEVVGAEYKPDDEMLPALADHVTAVFEVPVTVAVNC